MNSKLSLNVFDIELAHSIGYLFCEYEEKAALRQFDIAVKKDLPENFPYIRVPTYPQRGLGNILL